VRHPFDQFCVQKLQFEEKSNEEIPTVGFSDVVGFRFNLVRATDSASVAFAIIQAETTSK